MLNGSLLSLPGRGYLAILAVLAGSLCGCFGGDDGPKRYSVSGTVKFDGQPIPDGMIVFEHDETKVSTACPIVNGSYENESGKGHLGGKYTVFVNGYVSAPVAGMPAPELFQGRWTTQVELPAGSSTQDFDVPKSEVKAAAPASGNPADQS